MNVGYCAGMPKYCLVQREQIMDSTEEVIDLWIYNETNPIELLVKVVKLKPRLSHDKI